MKDTHLNEVPFGQPISEKGQERRLKKFNNWVHYKRSVFQDNAEAYANKRARKMPRDASGRTAMAEKILIGATFVPADPCRYEALGKGRGRKFKYFIVHRPGGPKDALGNIIYPGQAGYAQAFRAASERCTLLSTMIEFSYQPKNPKRPASTHFIIGKNGELVQMVDLDDVAYHTLDRRHPLDRSQKITNDNAVGVELEGPIFDSFTEAQLQKLAQLLRMMHDLYGISLDYEPQRFYVLGHDEIDPRRKKDPWKNFPYNKVLQWAQGIQPYDPKALFQEPVDIVKSTETLVAEAKRDALTLESGHFKEVAIAAADAIDVDARAGRKRSITRDQLMQQRATLSEKQVATVMEQQATMSKAEDTNANPVLTPPKVASLFDWTTGVWTEFTG